MRSLTGRWWVLSACAWLVACTGQIGGTGGGAGGAGAGAGGSGAGTGVDAGPLCDEPESDGGSVADFLPPGRLLRRASLVLRGSAPTDEEYAALDAAGDETAQRAFVAAFIDAGVQQTSFYSMMFELGREWLNIPLTPRTADEPEYGVQQQRALTRCAAGTPHAGKWVYNREDYHGDSRQLCDGGLLLRDGGQPEERTIEPWWAPGTSATLMGSAARTGDTGITNVNGSWRAVPCNGRPEGTCGCGPHAENCHADFEFYTGWEHYVEWNEHGQRRELAEEPARYFAHLAWHDRPITDLILSSQSVGTTNSIAAYVMQGGESGDLTTLNDDGWWRPSKFMAAPTDPFHTPGDRNAWREFDVPAMSRVFISDRDYKYDPRLTPMPMRGVPAAGILTSLGFLAGQPRERLRAARMLEALACEVFAPPSGQAFNHYQRDPAIEGPCQHCHKRIDPAAIHFKRFAKAGNAAEGYGATYPMPGLSAWMFAPAWRRGQYPYSLEPFSHFNRWYEAATKLTPVLQSQLDADPMAAFIDFLPPDQTLLGQVSDGTVGPLGFAKMIVASGSFDRCVVRRLHTAVMGRDIDPAKETGYLDKLTAEFISGGRRARPFVRQLMASELFQRGF